MKVAMPSVGQALELPPCLEYVVPPDWEDLNGHVNFQYYLRLYYLGGEAMYASLGIGRRYPEEKRRGFFELEHHIWYLDEMHVGDTVSVHVRYYDRSAKRFHGAAFMVNRTRGTLACVFEFVTSGADLDSRRTADFDPAFAALFDERLVRHRALSWGEPRSGVIAA